MFSIKKYNFTSEYAAFLVGISISFFSSGVLSCTPDGHMDFHNKSTIPLKIVIKSLPYSWVHCDVKDVNDKLKHNRCKDYKLKYRERTIDLPAKKNGRSGKYNGVCMANDGRYIVSYQAFIGGDKQMPVEGPAANVIDLTRGKLTSKFRLKHSGNHRYVTSSGCGLTFGSTLCAVYFYNVL